MEVGGVEKDVGVTALVQRPVQKSMNLDVDVDADAAHLGSGDAALNAQSRHRAINLAA